MIFGIIIGLLLSSTYKSLFKKKKVKKVKNGKFDKALNQDEKKGGQKIDQKEEAEWESASSDESSEESESLWGIFKRRNAGP